MNYFSNNIYKAIISKQVKRFIIVGSSTVLLDLFFYSLLVNFGLLSSVSKGLSFTVGAIYAYITNKNYTFQHENYGLFQFSLFILLYIFTLIVNVIINELILIFFDELYFSFILAFLSATFVSATLNFLGMKYIVFNKKDG